MIRTFLLMAIVPLLLRADDAAWSKPVNGLQARFYIPAPATIQDGADHRPHVQLLLQLKRRDDMGALMQVAYTPDALAVRVVDEKGGELKPGSRSGNIMEAPWQPLIFPRDAFLSFPIGLSGWMGTGVWEGEYLDLIDEFTDWKIAPSSRKYFVEGTFTVKVLPRDFSNPNQVWGGTLLLPKIQIPRIP